jgi:hypothetical protein
VISPDTGLRKLLEVLDRIGVDYFVAGSLASSIHGVARTTADVDLVADFRAEHVEDFVSLLERDFYVDAGMIREALLRGRSFNVIHLASAYKFDLFPLGPDPYSQIAFQRREWLTATPAGSDMEISVAAAEDIVLSKLRWYRDGGGTSTPQWNDVLGVLRAKHNQLDLAYLRQWAAYLHVSDLLEEALKEAGVK